MNASAAAAPVASGGRIAALDALRGVALLGILIANVRQMFWPFDVSNLPISLDGRAWLGWLDWAVFRTFVDLKFITLFSLLFGLGFALQSARLADSRAADPDPFERRDDFRRIYLRRLAVLALFGIAHGLLLYSAEVLLAYALAGLLLFAARGWSVRSLAATGLVLTGFALVWGFQVGELAHASGFIAAGTLAALSVATYSSWPRNPRLAMIAWIIVVVTAAAIATLARPSGITGTTPASEFLDAQQQLAAMQRPDVGIWPEQAQVRADGNVCALLALHAAEYLQLLLFLAVLLLWRTVGLFMLGATIVRSRLLETMTRTDWRRVTIVGLALGGVLSALATALEVRDLLGITDWRWPSFLHALAALPFAIGIAGAVWIADAHYGTRGPWQRVRAAGRMALSNYIGQSLVVAALAESWGFGLYGRVGGVTMTAIAIGVFVALASLSHVWLQHFAMGPLEWLWRCATYGRWLPNRYSSAASMRFSAK